MDSLFPEMAPQAKPRPRIGRPGEMATTIALSLAVQEAGRPIPARTIEVMRQDIYGAARWVEASLTSPRNPASAIDQAANCPTARALRREYRLAPEVRVMVWKGHAQIGETVYALPIEVDRAESWWIKSIINPPHVPDMKPFRFSFDDQTPIDTL